MDKKTLGGIAVGIILLMSIVVVQGMVFGGIDGNIVRANELETQELVKADKTLETEAEAITEVMRKTPSLQKIGDTEQWNQLIADSRTRLQEARESLNGEGKRYLTVTCPECERASRYPFETLAPGTALECECGQRQL